MADKKTSSKRTLLLLLVAAITLAFSTPRCFADLSDTTYGEYVVGDDLVTSTNPLTVGAGLVANSNWADPATSLSWAITLNAQETLWHYEYTFTVPEKAKR